MDGLHYGVAFKTERQISEIEDWLDQHCSGDWDVRLRALDDADMAHMKKVVEVYFELEEDKLKFRQGFGKH